MIWNGTILQNMKCKPSSSFSYLGRNGLCGHDNIAGDPASVADLEAGCCLVPNQDIVKEKLVLVCHKHTFAAYGLQHLAKAATVTDPMLLVNDPWIVSHKSLGNQHDSNSQGLFSHHMYKTTGTVGGNFSKDPGNYSAFPNRFF